MKHRIHNHSDMEKRYGISEDHCIIDIGLYLAILHTFGTHFDDSATELVQHLRKIQQIHKLVQILNKSLGYSYIKETQNEFS